MAAGKHDITIDQGSTWSITLILKQSNGLFMNLSGYTGIGKIKKTITDPIAAANFEVTFPDPLKGKICLKLSSQVTSSLSFSRGVYDFKIISPDEVVTKIIYGSVIVNEEVSKEDIIENAI